MELGLAYAVGSFFGGTCHELARAVGFGPDEATYIADGELRFFFGCLGASLLAVHWRRLDPRTTATFFAIAVVGVATRYAVFRLLPFGSVPLIAMIFPGILAAALFASMPLRGSPYSDIAGVGTVWLIGIGLLPLAGYLPPIPGADIIVSFLGPYIGFLFFFWIIPNALEHVPVIFTHIPHVGNN